MYSKPNCTFTEWTFSRKTFAFLLKILLLSHPADGTSGTCPMKQSVTSITLQRLLQTCNIESTHAAFIA